VDFVERIVLGMAAVRFLSAGIELTAASLMLYFNRVETALQINAALALVGPTVLVTVTALGLAGVAGRISATGLLTVAFGVALIFLGLRQVR
jgi:hypothetical protein